MKETVENILPVERDWFLALNGSDSVFLDNVFWTITGRFIWAPIILLLLVMFFYKSRWQEGALLTLFFIVLFAVCDQVSSGLFKPFFERFRPGNHPDFKDVVDIVNDYRGGGYSFISGHATNSFGLAVFMSLVFRSRWLTIPVFIWAALNTYSRVYLGLHFLSDVAAGAIVGSLLGWLVYELYAWTRFRFFHVSKSKIHLSPYPVQTPRTIGLGMAGYIVFIVIFSSFLSTLPH